MSAQENEVYVRRFLQDVWNDGDVSWAEEFIAEGFVSRSSMGLLRTAGTGPDLARPQQVSRH
jgi:hypothetical protein